MKTADSQSENGKKLTAQIYKPASVFECALAVEIVHTLLEKQKKQYRLSISFLKP
jgi:hypothetical protein